ncbi:MAG: YcaO-like family protein [Geminicoccaceae bacterium]
MPDPGDGVPYRPGTRRTAAPQATLERVRPWLPAMGITRIANITGLDRVGIPTVTVIRPNSRSVAVAQGKGLDLASAKVSGVMEAIEVFHAETVLRPALWASTAELQGDRRVVDVAALPRLSAEPLPADVPVLWAEGVRLDDGGPCWLPFETVSTDYSVPSPPGSGWFVATTNGLASGNTRTEAVLHGLCEVIERDAVALWRLGGAGLRAATRLDPAAIADPAAGELLGRFARAGVAVGLWDATSDIGVACVVALVAGSDGEADPEIGAGCHPSRDAAVIRALTEAAQARVGFISGSRDDLFPRLFAPEARRARAELARTWLRGDPARRPDDLPDFAGASPDADLAHVRAALARAGFGAAVMVDLTRPPFEIPVVRIVVPGLEGPSGDGPSPAPGPRAAAIRDRDR